MIKNIYHIICLGLMLLSFSTIQAQFTGTAGDGFGFATSVQNESIFKGAPEDGSAFGQVTSLALMYRGHTGDGYNSRAFTNSESFYTGGETDGHANDDYKYYHLWTGGLGTDWLIAGNWTDGVIPTENLRVRIPASAPNMPGINDGVFKVGTSAGANYTCKELWIEPGALVTGRTNAFIEIHSVLVVEGLFRWRNQAIKSFICQPGSLIEIRQGGTLRTDY